ncbi:MAG: hypothetical protein LC115_07850 [Bacteroidia bacterium]|nr:hypothetical protein [Bacteroidia bacterium]
MLRLIALFCFCLPFGAVLSQQKPVEAFLWLTDSRLLQFQEPASEASLTAMPYTFLSAVPEEVFFQETFKAIKAKTLTVYRDAQLTTPISFTEIAQQFPVIQLKKKKIANSITCLHIGRFETWQLQDSTYSRTLQAWILRIETEGNLKNALSLFLPPNNPFPIRYLKMAYDYGANINQTPEDVMRQQLYNFSWTGTTPLPFAIKLTYPKPEDSWEKTGAYSIPKIVFKDSFQIPLFTASELSRYDNQALLQSIGRAIFAAVLSGKIKLQYFSFGNDNKLRYVPISYVREIVLQHPAAPTHEVTTKTIREFDFSVGLVAIEVFGAWEKINHKLIFNPQKIHLVWGQGNTEDYFGIGFLNIQDLKSLHLIFQNQPVEQILQNPVKLFWYPIQLNTYPIIHFQDARQIRCLLEDVENFPIPTARDFLQKTRPIGISPHCP